MLKRIISATLGIAISISCILPSASAVSAEIISATDSKNVTAECRVSSPSDKEYIWDYLMSFINNPYGVAALMGNMQAESGFVSNNLENAYESKIGHTDASYTAAVDNGSYTNFVNDSCGYGLVQFTYSTRKEGLLNRSKNKGISIGDIDLQLEYIKYELTQLSEYSSVYSALKNATNIKTPSDKVLVSYENPADKSDSVKNYRASLGQAIYNEFASGSSVGEASSVGTYEVSASQGSNVRSGPGTSYSVLGAATQGTRFTVEKINGEWGYTSSIRISTSTNISGWIHLGYCSIVNASTSGNIHINGVDIGYAVGDYFTKNGLSCYNTYCSGGRCHNNGVCLGTTHSQCNCMRYWPTGNPNTCKVDLLASQCFGFARYCQYALYGVHDGNAKSSFYTAVGTISTSNCTESNIKSKIYNVPFASHLRTGDDGHSLSIIATSDSTVVWAEANYDGYCRIRVNTQSWSAFASYLKTRSGILYVKAHNNGTGSATGNITSASLTVDSDYSAVTPFKAYLLNTSTVYPCYADCSTKTGGEIWGSDECIIHEVYTNGWCKVEYPASSGKKTAYTELSNFVKNTSSKLSIYYIPQSNQIAYIRNDKTSTYGTMYSNDKCYIVGQDGCMQYFYPAGDYYKLGWSDFNCSINISRWVTSSSDVNSEIISDGISGNLYYFWYSFKHSSTNELLYNVTNAANIITTLELYNPNGTLIAECSYSNSDRNWIRCTLRDIGNYTFKVILSGSVSATYTTNFEIKEVVCSHSYTSSITKTATCTSDGVRTYLCSKCGDSYTESILATGHSYTTTVISPTYTAQGYTLHDCIDCDYSYTEPYHDKLVLAPIDLFDVESDSITTDGANLIVVGSTDSTGFIIQQLIDGAWKNIANLKAEYGFASYRVSGLEAGSKCTFRAVAYVTENGLKAYSKYTSALSFDTEMKTPAAIQNFKAASNTADSITLSWTKNSDASGYVIQQMKNGVWTNIANIKNSATTSYKISGLNASTKYQFRAVAYITSGGKTAYSKYTSALSVTTNSIPKPSIVTELKVTTSTSNSITLSWNKVDASGYIVQCLKNNVWVNVANIKDSATVSHKITGLYENSSYKFRIVAYNKAGTSTVYGTYSSAVASRTSPAAVKNLKMTNRGTDFISVRWDKNADADGYMVYIYDGTKWTCVKTMTSNSAVSHKITGLESGKAYKVTVKAYKTVNGKKFISDTATISANTL